MEEKTQSGWFQAKAFTPGRTAELPLPQGEALRHHQWLGYLPCKEPNAVCQLITLETIAASSNMDVSYAHTAGQKAGYLSFGSPRITPWNKNSRACNLLGRCFQVKNEVKEWRTSTGRGRESRKGTLLRKIKGVNPTGEPGQPMQLLDLSHLRVRELGYLYSNSHQSLGINSLALLVPWTLKEQVSGTKINPPHTEMWCRHVKVWLVCVAGSKPEGT